MLMIPPHLEIEHATSGQRRKEEIMRALRDEQRILCWGLIDFLFSGGFASGGRQLSLIR